MKSTLFIFLSFLGHGVLSGLAQEESINMANAISWGKKRLAQRGIVNPGVVNYGYEYGENNEWMIKPDEAAIVNRIYKQFLNGETFGQITKSLTNDGEKRPDGKTIWSETTVRSILTNEVYRGNFLYHKSYAQRTIESRVVLNKGELPMYLIEGHHEAIISSEDWEKVQKIHADRLQALKEAVKVKYPEDTERNNAFGKKFCCGGCGGLIVYKRSVAKSKHQVSAWRCSVAKNSSDSDKCMAKYFRQEYMELSFMNMLINIQQNPGFDKYLQELLASVRLSADEERIEQQLQTQMDTLNQELYEVVDAELGKKGQDIKKVNELTEEIVKLQNQLKLYSTRKEQLVQIGEELDWLESEVKDLNDGKAACQRGDTPFNEEVFNRVIDSGIIFDDGKIVFKLKCGVEWSTSLRYTDYQEMLEVREAAEREAKKEAFLHGPEIEKLLEFCKEPRSLVEINAFLNRYKSKTQLIKAVIDPLMEDGRLQRKRIESGKRWCFGYYS